MTETRAGVSSTLAPLAPLPPPLVTTAFSTVIAKWQFPDEDAEVLAKAAAAEVGNGLRRPTSPSHRSPAPCCNHTHSHHSHRSFSVASSSTIDDRRARLASVPARVSSRNQTSLSCHPRRRTRGRWMDLTSSTASFAHTVARGVRAERCVRVVSTQVVIVIVVVVVVVVA